MCTALAKSDHIDWFCSSISTQSKAMPAQKKRRRTKERHIGGRCLKDHSRQNEF
jgi:hypothetical protein